jgi:hypothetical protein
MNPERMLTENPERYGYASSEETMVVYKPGDLVVHRERAELLAEGDTAWSARALVTYVDADGIRSDGSLRRGDVTFMWLSGPYQGRRQSFAHCHVVPLTTT